MGRVVAIRREPPQPPLSPECERALALIVEARSILEVLAEKREIEEGSPPYETLWYLDDAIGMLTPFTPEEEREFEKELRADARPIP